MKGQHSSLSVPLLNRLAGYVGVGLVIKEEEWSLKLA